MHNIRIALAQINSTVGDFGGNATKIIEYSSSAAAQKVDVVIFPELVLCGYPPEDLLLQNDFIDSCEATLKEIVRKTAELSPIIILGFPERGKSIYNSAALIYRGKIFDIYRKVLLPNYGVFDEKRYFSPGDKIPVYEIPGVRFGVNICEDIWHGDGPAAIQCSVGGCRIIFNISSSPFHTGKRELREKMICEKAVNNGAIIIYVNLVGGQDELVFDGQSFIADAAGEITARAAAFKEELLIADIAVETDAPDTTSKGNDSDVRIVKIPFQNPTHDEKITRKLTPPLEPLEEIWTALTAGLRDYTRKNGFKSIVLGLSGGIDSALVATIAAEAIGAKNVNTVFMPTRFTADESYRYAKILAQNIGIDFKVIEIEPLFQAYIEHLTPHFDRKEFDITEENIQARIRGNILMALSNKFGHLVLAPGNKSEMSVGYATLYGDMVGGFAVIKDVPKTMVWDLARWFNRHAGAEKIPKSIIERAPTAELRKNQYDTDTLPPYDILDKIIELYVEYNFSAGEIAGKTDFDVDLVRRILRMIDRAEYKRRQAPPGIKITTRAFGKERRMPITRKL